MKMSAGIGEDPPVEAEQSLRRALANAGGQALGGHSHPAEIVAFSRDEHWLATAAEDKQLLLRDLHDPDHPIRLPVGGTVEELRFSGDSRWLGAVVRDHAVLVWDLQSSTPAGGAPVFIGRRADLDVVKLCFSPGGHWLAYSWSDGLVQVCNLREPKAEPLAFDKHDNPANLLAFTPDETRLVTASDKETFNDQTSSMTMEVDALVWDLHRPDAAPQMLSGHRGAIKCLQFSPDGKFLFTGSTDNTIRVWDFAGRQPVFKTALKGGHTKGIFRLASTPNGRFLVSGGHDGLACVWDVPASLSRHSAAVPKVLGGHVGAVSELQVSGDGRWLLTHGVNDRDVQLWTMDTPEPAERHWTLRAHTALVEVAAFSEDGRWLLTAGDDKVARLWNLERKDPSAHPVTLAGHEDPVGVAAISARSRWVVLASGPPLDTLPRGDASVRLWDLDLRQPVASPEVFPGDDAGFGAQVSPDSCWIVMDAGENRLRLWRRRDRKSFLLGGYTDKISEQCFSPDGRWLATASEDGSGQLFDLRRDDPSTGSIRLHGHRGAVLHAAISPDSRWLVTGDNEQIALLWDLRAPDPGAAGHVLPGHEDGITVLTWSSDSRRLLTGTSDRKAFVWDTSGDAAPTAPLIDFPEQEESLNLAAFSPDGRWLATAVLYKPAVMLWDLHRLDPAAEPLPLRDHETQVEQMLFSNDSRWLVTTSGDVDGKLYDLHSSSPRVHLLHAHRDKPTVACFRSDNSSLATGGADASIFLWNLTADSPELSPIKCGGHSDAVQELAFGAGGRVLVSGGKDGTVLVWKLPAVLRGGTPVVLTAASQEELGSVDLADGGESIITGTAEGARVWPLSTARLTAAAEATAGRPLSLEEQALLPPALPTQPTFLERLFSLWKQLRGNSDR